MTIVEDVPKTLKLLGSASLSFSLSFLLSLSTSFLFLFSPYSHLSLSLTFSSFLAGYLFSYPFTVSKNHMLNVGSPHSWPILLGALSWLVDVSLSLVCWRVDY